MASVAYYIIFVRDIRADSMTPLAPVIYGASGYMKELTAEQKILVPRQGFLAALASESKGNTQGGTPLGSALLTFPRGKVSAARHERINIVVPILDTLSVTEERRVEETGHNQYFNEFHNIIRKKMLFVLTNPQKCV